MAQSRQSQWKDRATAPYNFVPLPQGVLTVPLEGGRRDDEERERAKQSYRAHVLADGRVSGYIALTIESKTPVFVGADAQEENFFSPNGELRIPGSSIRGMIKNLFKIVTCGAMRGAGEDYNDRTLYFRTMADKNLNKLYAAEMASQDFVGENRISKTKSKAGYLIQQRDDPRCYICPADFDVIPDRKGGSRHFEVVWGADGSGETSCYTGEMSSKSTYTKHHSPNWMERIPIPDSVVQAYREDISRNGVDLLNEKDKNGDPTHFVSIRNERAAAFTDDPDIVFAVPCFYKQEKNGDICHFGFGRFYRIPYHHSIGEHVLNMDTDGFDYADVLFGCKELWASRLAFTDGMPTETPKMETAAYPQILSEPKPTSVQLYLEQSTDRLAHWDDVKVPIRGYKLYWHQKNSSNWRNEDQKPSNMVKSRITPVKAGTVFHSSIRFERLSEDELGALLKTLRISGKRLCCKLGKGKSIGLGSVQISAQLHLTDLADSCRRAFDSSGAWNAAERAQEDEDVKRYMDAFDRVIEERLDDATRSRYKEAVKDLICMLDWGRTQHPEWERNIAQMSIEGKDSLFRSRAVLPKPRDVKKE